MSSFALAIYFFSSQMRNNHLIFRPQEKLQAQRQKLIGADFLDIDDHPGTEFKPGLFKQAELFLNGSSYSNFVAIDSHLENVVCHFQIIVYPH